MPVPCDPHFLLRCTQPHPDNVSRAFVNRFEYRFVLIGVCGPKGRGMIADDLRPGELPIEIAAQASAVSPHIADSRSLLTD
jgi:hypothetical protein